MRTLQNTALVLACILSGCTSLDSIEPPAQPPAPSVVGTAEDQPTYPYADLAADQLSNLLKAEFAIRERDLERGLVHLMAASGAIADPDIARRALQLAQYLRDSDATLAMATRVSDLEPLDGGAATLAAATYIDRGDITNALVFSRRAFDAGSDINPAALLNNYQSQSADTQVDVRALLESLRADYPDDLRCLFALALLEWRDGSPEEARAYIEKLLDASPYHERGTLLLTEIASQAGEAQPFKQLLAAIEVTDSALLRYQYARYLLVKQRLVEAKAQFDRLLMAPSPSVDYLIGAAVLDIELSEPESAIIRLDRAIKSGQRTSDASFFKGLALIQLEDSRAALDAFMLVAPSENYPRALQEAANILFSAGDLNAVDDFFTEQRKKHPQGRELSFSLHADTLDALGSISAIDILNEGVGAFPASVRLLFARANLLERADLFEQAEIDYRAVLTLSPGDSNALNALGYALTNNTNRFTEAAGLLEEAFSKDPRNPAIIDSLGWVYFKLGKGRQAELLLKEAYQQYPDPEVAAHLIELLWTQGREIEAKDLIDNQWRASPNNEHLQEMATRLAIPLPD